MGLQICAYSNKSLIYLSVLHLCIAPSHAHLFPPFLGCVSTFLFSDDIALSLSLSQLHGTRQSLSEKLKTKQRVSSIDVTALRVDVCGCCLKKLQDTM